MAILSKQQLEQYQLRKYQYGTDVRKTQQLYGLSGKIIFGGRWLSKRTDPIIIVEMNEAISEREARFYLEVNNHENIIRTLGYVENPSNLTIFIQEYAEFHGLDGVLMDKQFDFSPMILKEMFIQIADAMSYVASKRIVHGDLGCRNVLLFRVDVANPKNNLVKLTDFGLARWVDRPPTKEDASVIPVRFCAPEILRQVRHSSYSEKSDVYSMGALMWEALSNGEYPFSSIAEDEDVKQMKLNNGKLPQPNVCDSELWKLMNRCWDNHPERRPTFDEIRQRLLDMKISDITDRRSSVSSNGPAHNFKYELDEDVRMHGRLEGYFGKTYDAEWISKRERAIVIIQLAQEISEFEAQVYNNFQEHPHIVHTFGFVGNQLGLTLLLQERAQFSTLQTVLNTEAFQPSPQVVVTIFLQIIEAMIYVLSQDIVHGDLRCDNILVFQKHPSEPTGNLVKLANFSQARRKDPEFVDDRRLVFPVRYCALEILRSAGRSNYSEYSDVYSMGVLMWQVLSRGKLPYESSTNSGEVRQRKLNSEKLRQPLFCDKKIWDIVEDCWHNEPSLRYEFDDMRTRLLQIDFNTITTSEYELNRNIRQKRQLNGRFYEAAWIPKRNPPIVLLVIDGPTAEQEASLYLKLNSHQHIIHTFGLVKNEQQLVMLLQERAVHDDLQNLLESRHFQPLSKVLMTIFLQVTDAMIYLSKQDIIHGDLRCANILVFQMDPSEPSRNTIKLSNFSSVRTKDQSILMNRLSNSSIRYCAPEILESKDGKNYSEYSDVYSMGVLMWQALSNGELPYGRDTNDQNVRQQILSKVKLSQPKDCHKQIWSIIEGCWYNEPSFRFTFEDLKTQFSKGDLSIIDLVPCDRCNKSVLKNELENHKEQCSRKRPAKTQDIERIHVTRCKYCGARCLDNELHEHEQTCSSRIPPPSFKCEYCNEEFRNEEIFVCHQEECQPPIVPPPIPRISCHYCDVEYLEDEIANHRKKCPSKPRKCTYCQREHPQREIQTHETSCPSNPKNIPPPPQPQIRYGTCQYCHDQYVSVEIQQHETSCPRNPRNIRRVVRPPTPYGPCQYCNHQCALAEIQQHEDSCSQNPRNIRPVVRPSTPYGPCQYCNHQCALAEMQQHEKSCPRNPKNIRPVVRQPITYSICPYCHQQYPSTTITNHQRECLSRPAPALQQQDKSSFMNRLCLSIRRCCSN